MKLPTIEFFPRLGQLFLAAALILPALVFCTTAQHVFESPRDLGLALLAPLALVALVPILPSQIPNNISTIRKTLYIAVAFLGWMLVTAALADRKDLSFHAFYQFTAYAAVFLAAFILSASTVNRRFIILCVMTVGLIHTGFAVLQLLKLDPYPWSVNFDGRPSGLFGNPNFLAGHLALLLPLALTLALSSRRKSILRFLTWTNVTLIALILLATQTRGAWIAAAAGSAIVLFLSKQAMPGLLTRNRRAMFLTAMTLFLAIATAVARNPRVLQRVTDLFSGADATSSQRIVLLKNSLTLAARNPIFGVGPGNFRLHYPTVQSADLDASSLNTRDYVYTEHAHNDLIHLAAETGFTGALLWLLFWLFLFHQYLMKSHMFVSVPGRVEREDSGPAPQPLLLAGLIASIAAIHIHGLFNFPMLLAPAQLTIWALAGLALRVSMASTQKYAAVLHKPLLACTIMFLLGLAWISIQRGRDFIFDKLWWIGQGEYQLQNFSKANSIMAKAIRIKPEEDRLQRVFGESNHRINKLDLAEESFKQVLLLNPADAIARVDLANLYMEQGNYAKVEETLLPLTSWAQNLNGWWELLAAALFNQQKWEDANRAYDWAIYFGQDPVTMRVNKASCLGNLGRYNEALGTLNQALAMKNDHLPALLGKGVTYTKMGITQLAEQAFERVLALQPGHPEAATYLEKLK